MGEAHSNNMNIVAMVLEEQQGMVSCVRKERRNAMGNIFQGVEAAVLQQLSGLPRELVQQLILDSAVDDDTVSESVSLMVDSNLDSSFSSSSSSSSSSEDHAQHQRSRIRRSFSETVSDEMRAALQNRQRRNAVGNFFDVLTASQKLSLVEHLQEQMERLNCSHADVSGGNGSIMDSLSELPSSSSSSTNSVNSPRSQGEIVCR